MMPQVLRVEQTEVRWSNILSKVCHQAKNLYNRANFLIKESLKKTNFSTIMTLIISSKRKIVTKSFLLIKSDPKAISNRTVNGVGGYVKYLCRVCVDPKGMTRTAATKYTQRCIRA